MIRRLDWSLKITTENDDCVIENDTRCHFLYSTKAHLNLQAIIQSTYLLFYALLNANFLANRLNPCTCSKRAAQAAVSCNINRIMMGSIRDLNCIRSRPGLCTY